MTYEYQLRFLGKWFRVARWIYEAKWHNLTGIKRLYDDNTIYQFNRPKWSQKIAILYKK